MVARDWTAYKGGKSAADIARQDPWQQSVNNRDDNVAVITACNAVIVEEDFRENIVSVPIMTSISTAC